MGGVASARNTRRTAVAVRIVMVMTSTSALMMYLQAFIVLFEGKTIRSTKVSRRKRSYACVLGTK
jgi:hypothetical protein